MQLHHFKTTLEKVSQLFATIETDNGHVSAIEKDLMLSYIRQLYDAALTNTPVEIHKAPIAVPTPAPAPKPVVVAPVLEVTPTPPPVVVAPPPPPAPPVVVKPVIPDIPFEIEKTPEPVVAPKVEIPVVAPKPVEVPRYEAPKITIAPIRSTPIINMPTSGPKPLIEAAQEEPEGFFGEKMSKELSDRLGETPIDDMRKGMGLNERILLMNELFDGDQRGFEDTINTVNSMTSFEEAKNYLLSTIAPKYNWAAKEKRAKAFAKVVRRRFAK
jgi:hypothetical protein